MGALYNKFHRETERNLRESLQLAESMPLRTVAGGN